MVAESNRMELVGIQDEQDTLELVMNNFSTAPELQQIETRNSLEALELLYRTRQDMVAVSEDNVDTLLLTTDVIRHAHGCLLKGLHPRAGHTRDNIAATYTANGMFLYTCYEEVDSAFQCVIDQHNHVVVHSPLLRQEGVSKVTAIFNLAAQLQLRFLTVHPFADGNGRLGRLLVNFIVQHLLPFPIRVMPPYAHRDGYLNAIIASREVQDGVCVGLLQPCELAALIVEGAWFCMKDAANLCRQMRSSLRGHILVGPDVDLCRLGKRYQQLHRIGLDEAEQQQEMERIADAAVQLRQTATWDTRV